MKKIAKKTLVFLAVIAFAASFTSCNRGYGCPNNFSVGETVTDVVTTVVATTICNND